MLSRTREAEARDLFNDRIDVVDKRGCRRQPEGEVGREVEVRAKADEMTSSCLSSEIWVSCSAEENKGLWGEEANMLYDSMTPRLTATKQFGDVKRSRPDGV